MNLYPCLYNLHILRRHWFRKENFMVNICLPLHKLAEYAETIGQLDVLIFIYHHMIILEYCRIFVLCKFKEGFEMSRKRSPGLLYMT